MYNENIFKKIRNILFIIVPFVILFVFVGNALVGLKKSSEK